MDLWLKVLEVGQSGRDAEKFVVDDGGELQVKNLRIVDCQSEKSTRELKVEGRLKGLSIKPEVTIVILRHEHSILQPKELLCQDLEEFLSDTSLVFGLLPNELDLEWPLEVEGRLGDLLEGVEQEADPSNMEIAIKCFLDFIFTQGFNLLL